MRSSFAAARAEIDRLIRASGADVAVAWQPLDGPEPSGSPLLIRADVRFHAASTMKIPVMIELFRRAATKDLRLDDTLVVTNQFQSIVDGSPYELSASEDSDEETYRAIGIRMTLRALCDAMITVSSNLAANTLIETLGVKNIQRTVERLGAGGMQVLRGVGDQTAFEAGLNNTTDARGLLTLLTKLARSEVVHPAASAEMIAILKRQAPNDGIPAGLPPDTIVAHKTGTITKIHHDAGIIYGRRPYVLVVLVRGIEDQKISARLIADITRVVNGLS
jgi:beta-lactamase class A